MLWVVVGIAVLALLLVVTLYNLLVRLRTRAASEAPWLHHRAARAGSAEGSLAEAVAARAEEAVAPGSQSGLRRRS